MEYKDYYKILGVDKKATQDEIKRAYRKLARKYHPDVSKEADAEARFKEVGEAYEVLKDPEKREAYDHLGANWQAGQDFRPPPDWGNAGGFDFGGGGFTSDDAAAYSDFFESLFGQRGRRGASGGRSGFQMRGSDQHARIQIDLEDAYKGTTRTLTLGVQEAGPDGQVRMKQRTLNVRIPKGVKEGQQIRLAGQGNPGMGGAEAGDLYLEIAFNPHPLYRVEGKDVYLTLPVAPWEAALGATIKVPTPDGPVDLRIPENSKSGRKLRLKGRGIPAKTPGDLYVVLEIALPPANDEKARQVYRDMQKNLPFNPRSHMGV